MLLGNVIVKIGFSNVTEFITSIIILLQVILNVMEFITSIFILYKYFFTIPIPFWN